MSNKLILNILTLEHPSNQFGNGSSPWALEISLWPSIFWIQWQPSYTRFEGAAGTRMPESPPGTHKCGTSATGWLAGVPCWLIKKSFKWYYSRQTHEGKRKICEFFPIVGQQILIMRHICPQVAILLWRKGRWGERSTSTGRAAYPNGAPLHKSSTVDAFMCITWRNPLCAGEFIAVRGRI